MKTPCCKKEIKSDDIWSAITDADDKFGSTCKTYYCPLCQSRCTAYLTITEIEKDDDQEKLNNKDDEEDVSTKKQN